jgi:hypothetical protein
MKHALLRRGRDAAVYTRIIISFWVRFPSDFQFAMGGRLCGATANGSFFGCCQWRGGGRAAFALTCVGPAAAALAARGGGGTDASAGAARAPVRFLPSRWTLVEQEFAVDASALCGRPDGAGGDFSCHTLRYYGWVNGVLCHEEAASVPCSPARATGSVVDALQVCAFYGGATVEWAAPADTHVDMAHVRVWGECDASGVREGDVRLLPAVVPIARQRPRLLFCISPGRCAPVSRRPATLSLSFCLFVSRARTCVTTSRRCGTLYLSHLLATAEPRVLSAHEPVPTMAGVYRTNARSPPGAVGYTHLAVLRQMTCHSSGKLCRWALRLRSVGSKRRRFSRRRRRCCPARYTLSPCVFSRESLVVCDWCVSRCTQSHRTCSSTRSLMSS